MSYENWVTYRFEDVCDCKTGKLNSNASVENGKYTFFTCAPEALRTNTFSFDQDAILLAGNNANGIFHINRFNGKFDAYQRTYVINSKIPELLNNDFIFYSLKQQLNDLQSRSLGSATKFLTIKILNNLKFSAPSNSALMKQIANILSSLDDKIELNNKINKNLEELAQTLYKHWFVDFEFPNDDGLPYKSSGGEMVDSELGLIPIGWSYETLGKSKLTKLVRSGIDLFSDKKIYLATADVTDTTITNHNTIITYDEKPSRANMQPKDNTVWFAKMKNSRKLIRVSNESKDVINNYIFSTGFAGLECDKSLNYIWTIISDLQFDDLKNSMATGTTQEAINNGVINNIPLLVPRGDILEKFENITKSIFNLIAKNDNENKKLAETRDLLLPKLMSGEIRIPLKE